MLQEKFAGPKVQPDTHTVLLTTQVSDAVGQHGWPSHFLAHPLGAPTQPPSAEHPTQLLLHSKHCCGTRPVAIPTGLHTTERSLARHSVTVTATWPKALSDCCTALQGWPESLAVCVSSYRSSSLAAIAPNALPQGPVTPLTPVLDDMQRQ